MSLLLKYYIVVHSCIAMDDDVGNFIISKSVLFDG